MAQGLDNKELKSDRDYGCAMLFSLVACGLSVCSLVLLIGKANDLKEIQKDIAILLYHVDTSESKVPLPQRLSDLPPNEEQVSYPPALVAAEPTRIKQIPVGISMYAECSALHLDPSGKLWVNNDIIATKIIDGEKVRGPWYLIVTRESNSSFSVTMYGTYKHLKQNKGLDSYRDYTKVTKFNCAPFDDTPSNHFKNKEFVGVAR